MRRRGQAEVFELPTDAYVPAVQSRVSLPIARTIFDSNKLKEFIASQNTSDRPKSLYETKGHRLLQCYMEYIDPDGNVKVGKVQLDTQSNVSYCLPNIGTPREWKPWECQYAVGTKREKFRLGKPTAFKINRQGSPVIVDTNDPPAGRLTGDCIALLSLEAMQMLGIDLNYHASFHTHRAVKYQEDMEAVLKHCDTKLRETLETYAEPLTPSDILREINLSERVIQEFLDSDNNKGYDQVEIPLESLDICPGMSDEFRKEIIKLLNKYRKVFAKHTNTLPKAMEKVTPHEFKLKPGAKPTRVRPPKFGKAKSELILNWLDWAITVGLVEPADGSAYSARLHLAAKRGANTPKSAPPDDIRITWAGVEANDTLEKSVATYTNAWDQLYKVANYKYKFSADGLKQYWSIPLAEESRDLTTFWTPRGLFRFTRMVMGTKNAATVAQNAYTAALHDDLPKEFLRKHCKLCR